MHCTCIMCAIYVYCIAPLACLVPRAPLRRCRSPPFSPFLGLFGLLVIYCSLIHLLPFRPFIALLPNICTLVHLLRSRIIIALECNIFPCVQYPFSAPYAHARETRAPQPLERPLLRRRKKRGFLPSRSPFQEQVQGLTLDQVSRLPSQKPHLPGLLSDPLLLPFRQDVPFHVAYRDARVAFLPHLAFPPVSCL